MVTRVKKSTTTDEPTVLEAPALGDPQTPPELFVIGSASPVGTPGWYMGIGSRPETAAEHTARLGDSAGTSADIGWMLGSLEPRAEWPGRPPVVEEPEEL